MNSNSSISGAASSRGIRDVLGSLIPPQSLLFSFRQPFFSGEHIEKNDWNLSRRENRRGQGSYGVPDESDVQSVSDNDDVASMSPRMRDSIHARLDRTRHEPLAVSEIEKKPQFMVALNEQGGAWPTHKSI